MQLAIEVQGFAKTFRPSLFQKPVVAAESIDLQVPRGEIFGFLGPNGAGKTTTIKALLGLIRSDAGKLEILGQTPGDLSFRKRIGYAAEHPVFPPYLTALEMVSWFAQLGGLGHSEAHKKAEEALDLVGLAGRHKQRLKTFSKGMLQRAALAQAVVGQPELLILDEPMTGLDPIGRRDVRELILEMKRRGSTVFYSTHILPDIEATCDRVAIIAKGRTYALDSLDKLLEEGHHQWEVTLEQAYEDAKQEPFVDATTKWHRYTFDDHAQALAFLGQAQGKGCTVRHFAAHRKDLEDIFLEKLGKDAS